VGNINGVFSLFLPSPPGTFLPRGLSIIEEKSILKVSEESKREQEKYQFFGVK
jgi:hypothetical protein